MDVCEINHHTYFQNHKSRVGFDGLIFPNLEAWYRETEGHEREKEREEEIERGCDGSDVNRKEKQEEKKGENE
jgi:hypothetical protein